MDQNTQTPQQPVEQQIPPIQPTPSPMEQQPPPTIEMQPKEKPPVFSIITIVVVVIAIAGYLALASFYDMWPFEKGAVVEESPTPTARMTAEPTAAWKTYENRTFGFRFKYPDGMVIDPGVEMGGDAYLDFIVYRNEELLEDMGRNPKRYTGDIAGTAYITVIKGMTVDELIATSGDQFSDRKVEKETLLINGLTATRATVTTSRYGDWVSVNVYFQKDDLVIEFSNGAVIDNIRPMGGVVETFEFI